MLQSYKNQTKTSKVIQCPTCQARGIKQNLAIYDDGFIIIKRMEYLDNNKKRVENTIIKTSKFTIYCGRCNEPAFKHE
jgi:predicted PP-loop superfamily ATPase